MSIYTCVTVHTIMPPPPEVSAAIASLDSISDKELKALANAVLQMNDPSVARTLAEAMFARYLRRHEEAQPPSSPSETPETPETSGDPEA